MGENKLGAITPAACLLAGSPYITSSHGFRRTYIKAMLKAGSTLSMIMKRTGHRWVADVTDMITTCHRS